MDRSVTRSNGGVGLLQARQDEYLVTNQEMLSSLYKKPGWATLAAETDHLIEAYKAFVKASPYLILATIGPDGPACSPRGGVPGFVQIEDEKTLLIPDSAGNNRIETLRNIVHDPRIALHFLIPGHQETLRANGRAVISANPLLAERFATRTKAPKTVIVVTLERVHFHCGNSIRRARLWESSQHIDSGKLPGPNAILAAIQWRRCRSAITG